MPETLETYIFNIVEGKAGPVDSSRRGGSRRRATAREDHQHYLALVGALGSAGEDLGRPAHEPQQPWWGQWRARQQWETDGRTARERAAQVTRTSARRSRRWGVGR
jgi:hypothetical protein